MSFIRLFRSSIYLFIFNFLITISLAMDKKIILIRFYRDDIEETDYLYTDQNYSIDLLARNLVEDDQIYLIRGGEYAGEQIPIDKLKMKPLKLYSKNPISNKYVNYKFVPYLAHMLEISLENDSQFFYSTFKFAANEIGKFSVCINNSSNQFCFNQETNSYLTWHVINSQLLSTYIVISISIVALISSALTNALTLGIMSLDTHELQVLIK